MANQTAGPIGVGGIAVGAALLAATLGGLWLLAGGLTAGRSAEHEPPDPDAPHYPTGARGPGPTPKHLRRIIRRLAPLHRKLGKPRPGDWLDRFDEPGQTFAQYLACRPVTPRGRRRVIYIQPLGSFTKAQRRLVTLTGEYLALFYNVPVKVNDDLPLSIIPDRARRVHPTWGDKQILSPYVLDEVLRPRLPEDAAACIALTTSDLWPGKGWNFVFGQASLVHRVGVWSLYRKGDAGGDAAARRLCLLRTLKTAAHEVGHMFSLRHCTAYECCMCGSNSLGESDRRPLALCPQCLAKVCWACRADPIARLRALADFCREHGLARQAAFYDREVGALGGRSASRPATSPAASTRPARP
jgi:archaemetzincin